MTDIAVPHQYVTQSSETLPRLMVDSSKRLSLIQRRGTWRLIYTPAPAQVISYLAVAEHEYLPRSSSCRHFLDVRRAHGRPWYIVVIIFTYNP
jgi:hypothetical protein